MPNLSVIPISWSGAPVTGPAFTVLHAQPGEEGGVTAAFRTFLNGFQDRFPTGLQWTFPTAGDVIDELSGHKVSTWSAVAPAPLAASGGGTFVNGVGIRVKWFTIGVVGGRSVVGSSFLVPLVAASYEGAGNVLDATISAVNSAAAAYVAATPNHRIYSRKNAHHDGISFPIVAAQCPDRVSWLRTRRT